MERRSSLEHQFCPAHYRRNRARWRHPLEIFRWEEADRLGVMTRCRIISFTSRQSNSGAPATIYRKTFPPSDRFCLFSKCQFPPSIVCFSPRARRRERAESLYDILSTFSMEPVHLPDEWFSVEKVDPTCHSNSDRCLQCKGRRAYPIEGGICGWERRVT